MTAAPELRILADDLTGALDSAAAFAGDVPVHFDRPADATPQARVQAVATATRDLPPAQLAAALAPSIAWLREAGIAFKKVDSLLRGNTFAELALVTRGGGFNRLVLAPAFPRQGRLTINGALELAQPGAGGGARGSAGPSMRAALAAAGLREADLPIDIPDVRDDADLLRTAAPAAAPAPGERRLWCGSAGLAHALAHTLGIAPTTPVNRPESVARPLVVVSASRHPVVRRQWALFLAQRPRAVVVSGGDDGALQAALAAMQLPFDCALLDLAPAELMASADAAALLARQLDHIACRAPRPGTLVVVGGDTLRALCRATGARGLLAGASAQPGWGQARWIGGPWSGLICHSRSGAFGDDDDLADLVGQLSRAAQEFRGAADGR